MDGTALAPRGKRGLIYLVELLREGPYQNTKFLINGAKQASHCSFSLIHGRTVSTEPTLKAFDTLLVSKATVDDTKQYQNISEHKKGLREYLLDIRRNPLKVLRYTNNTIEDLLLPGELDVYNHAPAPQGTFYIELALKRKLEEDPNYEVFLPLRYWRHIDYVNVKHSIFITAERVLVSNKGRVVYLEEGVKPTVPNARDRQGYASITISANGRREGVKLHRVVASTFITPKGKSSLIALTSLTVNHINGVKDDNRSTNLEWVTQADNNKHAIVTQLLTFTHSLIIGEVVVESIHQGFKFVCRGYDEAERHKFTHCHSVVMGRHESNKGCVFRLAEGEEEKGLPYLSSVGDEMMKFLKLSAIQKGKYK